ncbi:MAG TPA: flagellar FlbD family protein [Candidatus Baltobacteraceae bacterium]|nr:flagellar FlbD family protein [Candidatus Baltobacteraceae bacterium]
MIALRRPNGFPIVVNADLIETVETVSDGTTLVTLTSGNTLVVLNPPEEVRAAAIEFRRRIGGVEG